MGTTTIVGESATYEAGADMREGMVARMAGFDDVMSIALESTRNAGERMAVQIREHPFGSMIVAGSVGFLLASVVRSRSVPGLSRAALGIAAAALVREVVQYAMAELRTHEGDVTAPAPVLAPGATVSPD